jgi:predicted dehydrogenase
MKSIKIGIIGLSEGNGHPYSWATIINGDFDRNEMEKCGFAAIPVYLEANKDTLGIDGAKVTHIWTQERSISEHIAKASGIENVVDDAEEMIGKVDAVILARDDPENHVAMARPFLDADIPIFIDKPLAISWADLNYFKEQNDKGKLIMSCSSMRYANECLSAKTTLKSLGEIELATVIGVKDWTKYGIHMLEALFALLDDPKVASVQHLSESGKDIVFIKFENGILVTVHLFMDISPTFQLSLFGSEGWQLIEIKNSYSMFKENLIDFIRSVREGKSRLSFEKTENIIQTLIAAKSSLEQEGKVIYLEK